MSKNNRFNKQNNNFARASHFFAHFFPVFARLRRENLILPFIVDENKQRRNFISLSELEYGPLKFSFRRVAYNCQSKRVGIIAIKTEKTQIHFLSDVLVAVASLDLKVPICFVTPSFSPG